LFRFREILSINKTAVQKRKRWIEHAARKGFCGRNLQERDNLGNLDIGGRIILKWISKKQADGAWTGLMWLRTGIKGEGAVVKTAIYLRVQYDACISRLDELGLSFMELVNYLHL
jgi:hypothetical protein